MDSKINRGLQTRKSVLGQEHLDKVRASTTALDESFQEFITEYAWGKVWSNSKLSKRERSMLTLVILASQGSYEEFKLHVKASKNTKTSAEDMIEAMMHVAVYAGVPKANSAIKIIKEEIKFWD